MSFRMLAMLEERLKPLAIPKMPLAVAPPRKTGFGGPLALSKVHWVRPELSRKSPISAGLRIGFCATLSLSACGKTSRQMMFDVNSQAFDVLRGRHSLNPGPRAFPLPAARAPQLNEIAKA
jgi:hypothetical protein